MTLPSIAGSLRQSTLILSLKRASSRCASTAQMSEEVIVEKVGNKKLLTLNRPKALNALNLPMIQHITSELKDINNGKDPTELVILKGGGEKAFCAGGDVVAVSDSYKNGTDVCKDFFKEEYKLNHLIGTLKVPFVAIIDGITMGGGCGLSINGRFRVATERTLLAMPETALGLFPDVGGTYFLSRLKNRLGMFLALTGYRLKGSDVFHSGMATNYIPSEDVDKLVNTLLDLPKEQCTEATVDEHLDRFQEESCQRNEIPAFTLDEHICDIKKCFNGESVEQIFDNLRNENKEFCTKRLQELQKMSPTSLKVAFHQLKIGPSLKFTDVFPIEYRLTQRFLQEHDFHEGVRAILKDKDRNPKWKPSSIQEVTKEKVDW
ncbi:enoyl-CoA hydratase/isomerase domain-containing protein [Ditylenchus destructor]|nr:enoyl-CoA hydratase/isomerase domain-containing protein [Ditylenchus destructor]